MKIKRSGGGTGRECFKEQGDVIYSRRAGWGRARGSSAFMSTGHWAGLEQWGRSLGKGKKLNELVWKTLHKFVCTDKEGNRAERRRVVFFVFLPSFLFILEFKTRLHFYRKSSHRGTGRQFGGAWLWKDWTIDILRVSNWKKRGSFLPWPQEGSGKGREQVTGYINPTARNEGFDGFSILSD